MSRLSKLPSTNLEHILRIYKTSDKNVYIDYAVKQHRGNWYVYISRFGLKYIRRHGPYSTRQLAEDQIYGIKAEAMQVLSNQDGKLTEAHSQTQET